MNLLVGVAGAHLTIEHPDQPNASGEEDHDTIEDEVPELVTTHNSSLIGFIIGEVISTSL